MNTPSTGFQQFGEGLLNKFQSSKAGQMFGGKPRKKYDENTDDNKESVRSGSKKDPKYTNVPQGKVERLKVNESEADIVATLYNFMAKNYKKDLERLKKEKKHKKEIDDYEDLKNKQLIAALTGKKEKEKETKKGKGFGFGSLLKAGLAIGGLVLIEKAFAKMAETGKVTDVADVLKTTKKEESTSSLPGTSPVTQTTPSSTDTTEMRPQGMSGKSPYATKEAKEAFDFFIGKGYTKEAAAGIVANLQAESGPHLNTKALGDNGKAKGIAQWQEARQKTFKEVVGKDVFDASRQEQLGHVDYELKNTHKKAGLAVNQQKTAGEAAAIVDKDYEQSKGLHRQKRMGIAEDLLSAFGGNTATPMANKSNIPSMQSNPSTVVAGPATIAPAPAASPSKRGVQGVQGLFNPKVKLHSQEESDELIRRSIAAGINPEFKSYDELLKEYEQKKAKKERKKLLNPELKNVVPDEKTSMMDRMKQLISSNIIVIEKEKIVNEVAESNDTSILFSKIQQLS
jgi:hypothetical protein